MIKVDANNAVCTMDMWNCIDETGPVSSWQGQWLAKPPSASLLDWQQRAEVKKAKNIRGEEDEAADVPGVEERGDRMSDEGVGAARLACESGPSKQADAERGENTKPRACRSETGAHVA